MKALHATRKAFRRGFIVPAAYRRRQSAVVHARLRMLAPVIAVLVLVWIPIDMMKLAPGELAAVLPLRALLAAGLVLLARFCDRLPAHAAVAACLWLQAAAFGAMTHALSATKSPLHEGYGLFPFAVAAQLAVFALPWGRNLAVGLAPLSLLLAPVALGARPADAALWNALWLMGLILAFATWAAHLQLRLLVELLGAQRDASSDALTGLANRRAAELRLQVERARAERRREPLSVAMLDLDHFKRINDRWGHATGDRVLQATAHVLQDELRGADLGARFGGEEFLAILPATDARCALHVAERIRERLGQLELAVGGRSIHVTSSIGVATLQPAESLDSLLERADAALYRAKAEGRNRSVLAEEHAGHVNAAGAAEGR